VDVVVSAEVVVEDTKFVDLAWEKVIYLLPDL